MKPEYLVLDIETVGEPWDGELTCLGLMWPTVRPYDKEVHWLTFQCGEDIPLQHRQFLADSTIPKVTHTKYDARWLRLHGVDVRGPFHDTQVMAWVLNENQDLSLDALALRYLGLEMDKRISKRANQVWFRCDDGTQVPLAEAPRDQLYAYNLRDLEGERDLYLDLRERMDETAWADYWEREQIPLTEVLVDMECAGLPVDLQANAKLRDELEVELASLGQDLHEKAGLPGSFNLASGDQLAAYLFGKRLELKDRLPINAEERTWLKLQQNLLKNPTKKQKETAVSWTPPEGFHVEHIGSSYVSGSWWLPGRDLPPTPRSEKKPRPSTSTPNLMVYCGGDEWVQELIRWRKRDKVLTTYLRVFPEKAHEGRIYARFNQTGTKTGRLSSAGPNLQNQPAHGELGPRVRALFTGNLIIGDYSQLEPRLMAHFSQDPNLLDIYRSGKDLYIEMAHAVLGEWVEKGDPRRQMMKTYVLGLGYGAMEKTLQRTLALNGFWMELEEVKFHLGNLREWLGVFFDWREGVIRHVHQKGYVRTLSGRHRRLRAAFKDRHNWRMVGYGERQAVNAIIQGSAGDIVNRAMVAWAKSPLTEFTRLLLQVHDELGWDYLPEEVGVGAYQLPPDDLLDELRDIGENQHGFDLSVPMVFEPSFCNSWAEKGGKPVFVEDEEEAA